MQVVFIHPDLGIGGAERLVVDAALALKSKGHRVSFITGHHDRRHCFEETKNGTFSVTTVGEWIPLQMFGVLHAFLAYLKMIYLALYLVFMSRLQPDVIFCDQISICIPFLRWGTCAKIVFYCHYPDKLLAKRDSFLKSLYRIPLDWLEERTTGMAHLLLVNSHYTASVFREAFPSLKSLETHVLHPSLNTDAFDRGLRSNNSSAVVPKNIKHFFLSLNRYERKKNLCLAVHALDKLRALVSHEKWCDIHLVIAGGYDERVKENIDYFTELNKLVDSLKLRNKVTFYRSIPSCDKIALLKTSSAVLYTPDNEHFGIVPIEAMYMKTPVIAVNSGGPKETVIHEETGFLCRSEPTDFANAMFRYVNEVHLSRDMGEAGRQRVISAFSFEHFAVVLCGIIQSILN